MPATTASLQMFRCSFHRVLIATASLVPLTLPSLCSAKVLTHEYERLAGISGFELDIVPLSNQAKAVGLSESDLRFLIEANLKKAALPWQKQSVRPVPYLLADVRVVCSDDISACSFVLALRFDDVVQVRGNTTYAQTWEWSFVGIAARTDIAAAVLAALRDRGMPNFVRDYLRANP